MRQRGDDYYHTGPLCLVTAREGASDNWHLLRRDRAQVQYPRLPPKGYSELEEEDKTQREEYWTPFEPKWRPEPFIRPQIPPTRRKDRLRRVGWGYQR